MIPIKARIKLDKFQPRPYQRGLFNAIEKDGIKRAVLVWHRRAGKDVAAFNLLIRQALKSIGQYYYILPTYRQARLILFEGMIMNGQRFLDFIPEELISKVNIQEMKVSLINGSQIHFLGSDNIDRLRGSNPKGIIFSEYAFQHPSTYPTLRPVLVANDGWCVFISTPNGHNSFYKLYKVAQESEDWYCDKLTIEDTNVISVEQVEKEREEGLMSDDMIEQEYNCSFSVGATGAYYAKYLTNMEFNSQIGVVDWEPAFPVYTAWDLGIRDSTVIIFFQIIGKSINVIDLYAKNSHGMEHYISVVLGKPYQFAKHFAPSDIMVREFSSGMSRYDKAKTLGIKFESRVDNRSIRHSAIPNIPVIDGIEAVRTTLPKMYIDQEKCKDLITALRNYRKEYDSKNQVYKQRPLHDKSSDYCFTADTNVLTRSGMRHIIDIKDNDYVMTLEGWKQCSKAYKTKINASLVEITFQDGTKVKCTPEHTFLTENGWKSAKNLRKGSKIRSSLMKKHNSSVGKFSDYIREENTSQNGQYPFTDMSGPKRLALYLTGIISTIKIGLQQTIVSTILNVYQHLSIDHFLNLMLRVFRLRQLKPLLVGMGRLKAKNGIQIKQIELKYGKAGRGKKPRVNSAKRNSIDSSEVARQQENFVMPTAELLLVESVCVMKERAEVYDIYVPGTHHFSLSNGAIVHNCDALRYMCLALPKCKKGMSAEDLERSYQEAVNPQSNMPSIFRTDLPPY